MCELFPLDAIWEDVSGGGGYLSETHNLDAVLNLLYIGRKL